MFCLDPEFCLSLQTPRSVSVWKVFFYPGLVLLDPRVSQLNFKRFGNGSVLCLKCSVSRIPRLYSGKTLFWHWNYNVKKNLQTNHDAIETQMMMFFGRIGPLFFQAPASFPWSCQIRVLFSHLLWRHSSAGIDEDKGFREAPSAKFACQGCAQEGIWSARARVQEEFVVWGEIRGLLGCREQIEIHQQNHTNSGKNYSGSKHWENRSFSYF